MSRTLGSFNQRVNLPNHPEDFKVSRRPRIAALKPERIPEERGGTTGAESFAQSRGRGRRTTEKNRFAGNALNVDLRSTQTTGAEQETKFSSGLQSAFAPPLSGGAESRTALPPLPSLSF